MPRAPRRPRRPRFRLPRRRPRSRRRAIHRAGIAAAVLGAVAFAGYLLLGSAAPPPDAARAPEPARPVSTAPAAPSVARAGRPARPPAATRAAEPRPPRPRRQDRPPRSSATVAALPAGDRARVPAAGPRAAILIDDLGQSLPHLAALAELRLPLSVAILPGLPATERTAAEAGRRGIETLLHLPMEPREPERNPGPGAILTTMSPAEIAARVREALAAMPGAVGVNNHMGSGFTEDSAAMAVLMAELRGRDLFWIDSRTTAATVAVAAAAAAGVPAAARDVFLDAEVDPVAIRAQLRRLVGLARRRGDAIGIGHPHPETLAALAELRDELAASGVTWVPVSALVAGSPARHALARVPVAAGATP